MVKYLKTIMPKRILRLLRKVRYLLVLYPKYKDTIKRALNYSSTFQETKESILSSLLIESHVLEKGITMPGRRLGFGYERVRSIISRCNDAIQDFGDGNIELQAALADLKQYYDIHRKENFQLPKDITDGIEKLIPHLGINDENCFSSTKAVYFKPNADFSEFANSRHSVRWFDDTPVDEDKLMKAIRLAQTAPSACNRQATRVKIISSPEGKKACCELQHGNRGFGDKADRWLLITSELGDWAHNDFESAYIDAGIFTMNLLYALHYYGIVACTLNACLELNDRDKLQKALDYPETEIPIVFIIIGNPAEKFMVPKSRRLNVNDIIQRA